MLLLTSCSQQRCEDKLPNQFPYEVIYIENGTQMRRFFDRYLTLYKDTFTTFSYDYCANGRLKSNSFKLTNGKFRINPL